MTTPIDPNWRCSTAAFSFFLLSRKAAANELIESSCAGDNCCVALKWEREDRLRRVAG
ncbi:MAG: hypothetical protein QM296_12420 [Bacillota bacterium]|nr:hypothetical protein [Bacillota bacterium]